MGTLTQFLLSIGDGEEREELSAGVVGRSVQVGLDGERFGGRRSVWEWLMLSGERLMCAAFDVG